MIATRIGGIPELVLDGINGALFEPNSVDDLLRVIRSILADNGLQKRFSNRSFQFSNEVTFSRHVEELVHVYRECVGSESE